MYNVPFTKLNTMCTIECEQNYPNKPTERINRAIVAHFRTWQKHTCMEASEKGHQCIKAASLYETLIKYSTQVLRV